MEILTVCMFRAKRTLNFKPLNFKPVRQLTINMTYLLVAFFVFDLKPHFQQRSREAATCPAFQFFYDLL
jgi:hypothetical protein